MWLIIHYNREIIKQFSFQLKFLNKIFKRNEAFIDCLITTKLIQRKKNNFIFASVLSVPKKKFCYLFKYI